MTTRAGPRMSWVRLHTSGPRSAWGTRGPEKPFGGATEVALPRSATPNPPPGNTTVPKPSRSEPEGARALGADDDSGACSRATERHRDECPGVDFPPNGGGTGTPLGGTSTARLEVHPPVGSPPLGKRIRAPVTVSPRRPGPRSISWPRGGACGAGVRQSVSALTRGRQPQSWDSPPPAPPRRRRRRLRGAAESSAGVRGSGLWSPRPRPREPRSERPR